MNEPHRYFIYWCTNCKTVLRLETAELVEDDSRSVRIGPYGNEPACPMCGHRTMDWDEVAVIDESFRNRGTWEDFLRWQELRRAEATGKEPA